MSYYVYWVHLPEHKIKEDGYVGITNNPKNRWADHKYMARKGLHRNSHFQNAINKYQDLLIHEIILEGTLEECANLENNLRPSERIGWNCHIGGECPGMTGRKHTEESKQKMREASIKNNAVSVMHNKESWDKISKAMRGGNNHQAKKIQCNETKEIFDTVTAAGKWLGTSSQAVSKHLKGKSKTVKGFTFNYYEETNDI